MFRENISPKRFKANISSLHEVHNRKRFYIPVIFYFHISVTLPTLQAFVDQQFSFVKRNQLSWFPWLFCDNSSLRFAWELCHLSQDKIIWIRCNSWWHLQWIFFRAWILNIDKDIAALWKWPPELFPHVLAAETLRFIFE